MNKIIEYYNQFDEWGRLEREPLEFMVNWHYIRRFLPDSGHILDNGAGTGVFNHSEEGRFTGAYCYNIEDIKPC